MKKYAIIVAGGSGQRMGSNVPKQFLLLHGKPVLYYTLKTFFEAYSDVQIILVLPKQHLQAGEELAAALNKTKQIAVTEGGITRFNSVKNGLRLVTEPSIIFVHDGVRCLATKELIHRCYKQAEEKGSAIPAVAATDSIRMVNGEYHQVIDRNKVKFVQTPQTFQSHILLKAFEQDYQETFSDEASVVEASGTPVFLIEGEHQNLKITRQIDMHIAAQLLVGGK